MTPKEAYEEAFDRIREAAETGAVKLEFTIEFNRLPPELERLTSLQSLVLFGNDFIDLRGITDLTPLVGLTSLKELTILHCKLISDLSPLSGLTSLQTLHLSGCLGIRRFTPLKPLFPRLKVLSLFHKLDDLPSEVCGDEYDQNVLFKVRVHYIKRLDASPTTAKTGSPQPPAKSPQVFVSYAWGDNSPSASDEDRQRKEVIEQLCRTLEQEHWQVVRDKNALHPGDLISTFMKTLGQADLVIVVLSDKYLRSPFCMTELYDIYQNSRQERHEFLNRIIPLLLKDANIGNWRGRSTYAEHWETEFKAMEQHFTHLGEEDLKLYKAMRRWHNEVGDMLAYVNDVLTPHGFDDIVKDDFASLRQMLSRRIDAGRS